MPVTPCAISYAIGDGTVADDICYWGDDVFGPHLLNLLGKLGIRAHVEFGRPHPAATDRKETAKALHGEVLALYRAGSSALGAPVSANSATA